MSTGPPDLSSLPGPLLPSCAPGGPSSGSAGPCASKASALDFRSPPPKARQGSQEKVSCPAKMSFASEPNWHMSRRAGQPAGCCQVLLQFLSQARACSELPPCVPGGQWGALLQQEGLVVLCWQSPHTSAAGGSRHSYVLHWHGAPFLGKAAF